jgi:AcrR family transcriptional regulator
MSTPRNQDERESHAERAGGRAAARVGGRAAERAGDRAVDGSSGRAGAAPKRRGRPPKKVVAGDQLGLSHENPTAELPATARTILAAARRVLAERGLEGLTIEAVAHEAQVGRHVIPYHFGSRAGLVTILFDSLFHDLAVGFYNRRASGPRGSLADYLEWTRQEAEDESAQRDFFELIVVALREPELRRRIAALYNEYRDLTLELSGITRESGEGGEGGDAGERGSAGEPAGRVAGEAERRRQIDAVGSVLMAIGDGIGLHAVLDPEFDLEGAIAAVDFMIGDAVASLAEGSSFPIGDDPTDAERGDA